MSLLGFVSSTECLGLGDKYFFLLGRCYFIETTTMNGEEAATNCQTQFGSFGSGRLFEPQDVATNDQVVAEVAAADSGMFFSFSIVQKLQWFLV